jgi:hypothetical protein
VDLRLGTGQQFLCQFGDRWRRWRIDRFCLDAGTTSAYRADENAANILPEIEAIRAGAYSG